jgi:hypothetical protein
MSVPSERVRIVESRVLSDNWYVLKTTTFDFRRSNGTWQRQHRETYDRGNGAVVLLYQPQTGSVVLMPLPRNASASKPRRKQAIEFTTCARSSRPS